MVLSETYFEDKRFLVFGAVATHQEARIGFVPYFLMVISLPLDMSPGLYCLKEQKVSDRSAVFWLFSLTTRGLLNQCFPSLDISQM